LYLVDAAPSETKSLLPFLYKREELPSLEKRDWGRFSEEYVYSIMDSLVTRKRSTEQVPGISGRWPIHRWFVNSSIVRKGFEEPKRI
jgi:hypothetical protein